MKVQKICPFYPNSSLIDVYVIEKIDKLEMEFTDLKELYHKYNYHDKL